MSSEPQAQTPVDQEYKLDDQIGFLLRKAYQRNSTIFADLVPGRLTTTQFSIMFRLVHDGPMSQNLLGRSVAMDAATTKGVVDRLIARGFLQTRPDLDDRRRHLVSLTEAGTNLTETAIAAATSVTTETLAPLDAAERETLCRLLLKIT